MERAGGFVWKISLISLFCFFYLTTESLGQTVKVTSSRANLRSGPGVEYQVIARVAKGKLLDVVKKKGDWLKVRRRGEKEGWVHGKLVKVTSPLAIRTTSVNRENLRKTTRNRVEPRVRKPKRPKTKAKKQEVFVFRKVKMTESSGMLKVTGEMTNRSRQDFLAVGFIISFFDVKQKPLGIGEILIDDFEKGETKPFTTYLENVSYHRIDKYRIQFDFGI